MTKVQSNLEGKGMHVIAELINQLKTQGIATIQTVFNAVKPSHPSISEDFVKLILEFAISTNIAKFNSANNCFFPVPTETDNSTQDTCVSDIVNQAPPQPKIYTVTLPNGLTISGDANQIQEAADKYPEYPLYHSQTKDQVLVIADMHTEHLMNSLVRDLNEIPAGVWTVTDLHEFFKDNIVKELIKRLV